jgi:hypothetical protein
MNGSLFVTTTAIATANNSGVFFYNRTDFKEIISNLSPLRQTITKTTPKLYYIGLLTNILCTIIFLQKQLINKKSIFYLIFLSVSDFLYNFVSLIPEFLIDINLVEYDIFKRSNIGCFFYDFRITLFHFFSVLLTLFVTIERFHHIYHPLKLGNNIFQDKKYLCVSAIFTVSFLLALPHGFLMVFNRDENDCDARDIFRSKFLNTSFTYYQLYFTFTEPLIVWFIPGIIILVLNSCVIYKIIRTNSLGGIRVLSFGKKKNEKKSDFTLSSNQLNKSSTVLSTEENPINKNILANQSEFLLEPPPTTTILAKRESKVIEVKSNRNVKIKANKISQYITIIVLGFYFILTTIPYVILLSLQNNLTLKLNYFLNSKSDYLNDSLWIRFGTLRDINSFGKLFFVSNHCINFFCYMIFNTNFRDTLAQVIKNIKNKIKSFF